MGNYDPSGDITLAVAFYRNPTQETKTPLFRSPLTRKAAVLLRLATGSQPSLDQCAARHSISAGELQRAAFFFAEQLIIMPDASHYQILGVDQETPLALVKHNYQRLMLLFHPDKVSLQDTWAEEFVEKINASYNVLRNPVLRQRYDDTIKSSATDQYTIRYQQQATGVTSPNIRTNAIVESYDDSNRTTPLRRLAPLLIWFGTIAAALVVIAAGLISIDR